MEKELNRILKQVEKQDQLLKDGFVIFPFLSEKQVKTLTEFYYSVQKEVPDRFYSSTHSPDPSFRRKTSEFIKDIISPQLQEVCFNYRLLGGAFVVKPPYGKGLLPPHQDWNIVDESKYRSFNLWIPLTNVTIENGAVHILRKSHNRIPTYRGPGIDSVFKSIENETWAHLEPLIMSSGEALLYDHGLLHASPVNKTDSARLGVVCGIIPSQADMQLYFKTEKSIVSYQVSEDFFLEHDPMKGPQQLKKLPEEFSFPSQLTIAQFNTIFLEQKIKKAGWISRFFEIKNKN